MSRCRFALVVCLIASTPLLAGELPNGAVARLGVPRIDFGRTPVRLFATPDGKTVTANGKWFDLESGRRVESPYKAKGELCGFLADGRAVFKSGQTFSVYEPNDANAHHVITAEGVYGRVTVGRGGKVLVHKFMVGEKEERRWVIRLAPMPADGKEPDWKELSRTPLGYFTHPLDEAESKVIWPEPADGGAKVVVYDFATGKRTTVTVPLGKEEELEEAALSPDGRTLATLTKTKVAFYSTADGKELSTRPFENNGRHLAFTANGKGVYSLAAFVPLDPKAKVVPLTAPELDWYSFALLPGGRVAVANSDGLLRTHDLKTGKRLDDYSPYPSWGGVRVTDDGTAVSWSDGLLVTWDTATGRETGRVTTAAKSEKDLALNRGGTHLLTWDYDKTVWLKEVKTGKTVREGRGGFWLRPQGAFSADGELVAMRPTDDKEGGPYHLDIFGVKSGERKRRLSFADDSDTFTVSPDGRTVARVAGKGVQLVEAATGKVRWEAATPGGVAVLLSDAGGKRVVAVGHRGATSVSTADGKPTHHPMEEQTREEIRYSALSASGRWLAVLDANDGTWRRPGPEISVLVYDLDGEHPEGPVYSETLSVGRMTGVAVDDAGPRLITSHADGTCVVWDLAEWVRGKSKPKEAAKPDRRGPWEKLADPDPAVAQQAMGALLADPELAVPLFEKELTPTPAVADADVTRWVGALADPNFRTRDAATKSLAAVADQAEAKLRAALKASDTPEQAQRLEALVALASDSAGDRGRLRQVRAVEILERIGTTEAKKLLKALSGGASSATLTREAAESLTRLR